MTKREHATRKLAEAHGWQLLGRTGASGHWKLQHPRSGRVVVASSTPGDQATSAWFAAACGAPSAANRG